jgi:hypothetical protein
MRLPVDDIISDLKMRLEETRGLRNRIFLKDAIKALQEFRAHNEKKL